jgi:hypothetical protein
MASRERVLPQSSGRDPVGLTIGRQSLGKAAVAVALIALVV